MTRARLALPLLFVFFATTALAKDVYLSIGGTSGVFRTDARIFNPNDRQITIRAHYLAPGNTQNAVDKPVTITIEKRQTKIYDDVMTQIFGRGDFGALRLVSDDDFVATQRIYATSTTACGTSSINPCTLGQFVPGLDVSAAKKSGVLLQLKCCEKFRTNIGAVNPNAVGANVTWRLYDKESKLVATGEVGMPPYGVIQPLGINSGYFFDPFTADITDAWITFVSDQPIFAYASVVDNGSTDQTFVTAADDTGINAPPPPPPPITTVNVVARNFAFDVTGAGDLHAGDQVKFRVTAAEGAHGFALVTPSNDTIIFLDFVDESTIERTVTLPSSGTYQFFCTFVCGTGHPTMNGRLTVHPAH